jgi:predicted nucleic acid-binding Zn ribbon protein
MSKERFKIQPHTHCRVCSRSIPLNKIYCSKECEEKEMNQQKKSKRSSRIFTVMFIIIIVIMMVFTFSGGLF